MLPNFLNQHQFDFICCAMRLAPRKREILSLFLDGKSQKAVCARMGICRGTLQGHLIAIGGGSGGQLEFILRAFRALAAMRGGGATAEKECPGRRPDPPVDGPETQSDHTLGRQATDGQLAGFSKA